MTRWLSLGLVCTLVACGGDKDGVVREPEICTDGIDNDLDGFADCLDSDCFGGCIEECTNGVDDDDNGLVDCLDPACFGGLCSEICDDGGDNDLDGAADCLDSDCASECPETCDDGVDNDGDNQVDCDDPDCDSTCDADGDGALDPAYGGDDCDDADPNNFPDNTEICDGSDNDCDLLVDDSDSDVVASTTWYIDDDGDGYGNLPLARCTQPVNTVTQAGDCNDGDAGINPGAVEVCNGYDDNCDGMADDEDPYLDLGSLISWYPDNDDDGWGIPGPTIEQCAKPVLHADNDLDCDDTDPLVLGDEPWLPDLDNDGYGAGTPTAASCTQPLPNHVRESNGLDCDDADPFSYPGAQEQCGDGTDQDCDGVDPSCVQDLFSSIVRGGAASVDTTLGTYDGTESITISGNASGFVYCQYTWQTQDWANSPSASGPDPIAQSCSDPDGNPCEWDFTLTVDQGLTTGGDPVDCTGFYGLTPTSLYSPIGYGWTDAYRVGGANLGPAWMYYYDVGLRWIGLNGGNYNATTGDFSYGMVTDTATPVPP